MGNLAEGEFQCRDCGRRGSLHWLVTHLEDSDETNTVMEVIWAVAFPLQWLGGQWHRFTAWLLRPDEPELVREAEELLVREAERKRRAAD